MSHILQVLIFGALLGGVYALMASGLTLLFGVMRIVNLAHGIFILYAAYISYSIYEALGWDPIVSVMVTVPLFFLFGVVLYMVLFARIEGSANYVDMTVLLTFALALILEGILAYVYTGIFRSITPTYATSAIQIGPIFLPIAQLIAAAASGVLLLALFVFLQFTRTGHAIRATTQNRSAAQIVGVNVSKVSAISFGIGTALAGASGSLISILFSFYPARHWQWIAILLSLIVLGGLGSLKGAILGAFVLAIGAGIVGDTFGFTWAPITFYGALFLILLVRPRGMFGMSEREG